MHHTKQAHETKSCQAFQVAVGINTYVISAPHPVNHAPLACERELEPLYWNTRRLVSKNYLDLIAGLASGNCSTFAGTRAKN